MRRSPPTSPPASRSTWPEGSASKDAAAGSSRASRATTATCWVSRCRCCATCSTSSGTRSARSGASLPGMRSLRDFCTGVGFFLKGVAWAARNGRWWLFGLIPAVIAFVVYVVALILLVTNALALADFLTPFADSWSWREAFRWAVAVALFLGGLALAVLTFTAVTLTIGEPFYEKLSSLADGIEEPDGPPWWQTLPRSIKDSLVTLWYVLLFTVPLFFLGF